MFFVAFSVTFLSYAGVRFVCEVVKTSVLELKSGVKVGYIRLMSIVSTLLHCVCVCVSSH